MYSSCPKRTSADFVNRSANFSPNPDNQNEVCRMHHSPATSLKASEKSSAVKSVSVGKDENIQVFLRMRPFNKTERQ